MTTYAPELDPSNPELARRPDEECLATWWHQGTPGTTYWRCLVPARRLPGQTLPVRPGDVVETDDGFAFPRQRGDTAIWQFLGDNARSRIAFTMKKLVGTRTLIEVDDNYTRAAPYMKRNPLSPWRETIAEAGNGYSNEMHRILLPRADGIICATEYLADVYYEFNQNVFVCPNSIDLNDWQYERVIPDGIFRIVYYGSPSHIVDAPLVTKALKWAARQPNVEVYTVGFRNPSWSFKHTVIPWSDSLDEARQKLFRFDLGVAPLRADDWARGKSDIKALEYAMAGVLPLMSNTDPYSPWAKDFPNLMMDSESDWQEAIRWAVRNPDEVQEQAEIARFWVLTHRTIDSTIGLWREALNA